MGMKRLTGLFIGELIAVWASVIAGWVLHWRMPLSSLAAVPTGLILWISGFAYSLHLRQAMARRREAAVGRPFKLPRGYPMVEARAAMHLGVAIGFRSWPTLGVALACLALNLTLAASFRKKIRSRLEQRRIRL
jgi:hypothetical protein